jgi:hypothetical protein
MYLNETLALALEKNRGDLLEEAIRKGDSILKDFQKTVNNSLLYCDRALYLRLKHVAVKLRESTNTTAELLRTAEISSEPYRSNVKLLERTLFELSVPLRKMLRLDVLELKDFDRKA